MKLQCILPATGLTVGQVYTGQMLEVPPTRPSQPYTPWRFFCYNDRAKWETYNPHVFRPVPEPPPDEKLAKAKELVSEAVKFPLTHFAAGKVSELFDVLFKDK